MAERRLDVENSISSFHLVNCLCSPQISSSISTAHGPPRKRASSIKEKRCVRKLSPHLFRGSSLTRDLPEFSLKPDYENSLMSWSSIEISPPAPSNIHMCTTTNRSHDISYHSLNHLIDLCTCMSHDITSCHLNSQNNNLTSKSSTKRTAPRIPSFCILSLTPQRLLTPSTAVVLFLVCLLQGAVCLSAPQLAMYENLCVTNGQKIPVAWKCQGYVQCVPRVSGGLQAVWAECGPNLRFDPTKMACFLNYKCMSPQDAARNICPAMPRLKFPHPSSCALFFDCSQAAPRPGLGVWENECAPSLLFDEMTLTCVRAGNSQVCGTRPEPQGKCGYRLGCLDKNCTGLEDGQHLDPRFPFSESFYVCKNGSAVEKKTCEEDGHIFDPHIRECTDSVHEESVQAFCPRNPSVVFADPSRCSLLYDCSQATWHNNLKRYQTECAYPRMFDTQTSSCANFASVSCGHRPETVQPCDYVVGHCIDAGCIPCVASCLGLKDGMNAYPGRVLTGFYLVCQRERTIDIRTCPEGSILDPQMRACLTEISSQTLDIYCNNNPNGRLLHPSECSMFYSCSQANSTQINPNLPPRAIECKYPYLVDSGTVSCKPHTVVRCGARREPFSPCDYVSNRCTSKDCTRCELVLPSCYGKSDNYYPAINQEMTADYIICKDQRVMGSGTCPNGTIFDIRTLTCTDTVYPLSLTEYCTNYRTGRVQNPANCAQYYDCAVSLKEVSECSYPELYDVTSHLCLPYDQVNCAGRAVFLEPCDSFTFCAVQPCPYCNSAFPSCVGRNGQVGGFPFEPSMYYECVDGRLHLKYCQTTFNLTARACNEMISPGSPVQTMSPTTTTRAHVVSSLDSPENIRLTCQLNPRLIHPKNNNCAQFYNCSLLDSSLAGFVDECQVGTLFDSATNQCLPYNEVMCHGRFEPKQVCDYEKMYPNRTSGGYSECLDTFPTCSQTTNGIAPSKEPFSSIVIHCLNGRVVNITICQNGQFYDPNHQLCRRDLQAETMRQVCRSHPNQLLAHPLHCAGYIKCGSPVNPARADSVTYTKGECPYPLLFTNGLCSSYKSAKCGRRMEPVTPCDYEELRKCPENGSRCLVDSAHTCPDRPEHTCTPCEKRYPSCLGSPSGFRPYPGRLFTPDFISCDQGRTLSILKCVQSVFDPDARRCGLNLDIVVTEVQKNTASFCTRYPQALIPHPTHCARFYNCSTPGERSVGGTAYLQECPHPQLFNSDLRVCQNFIEVLNTAGCGSKFQPKHYCDYSSYCPSERFSTCTECRRTLISCENQVNGLHGNPPGQAVTRGFMYCVEGRVLATSLCPPGSSFMASAKSCITQTTAPRPGKG